MTTPLVSIVLPVYNGGVFLTSAIESLLNQTFGNFELIILNDGSTDNSLATIKRFAKRDDRIQFITRGNRGLIATLNEGIAQAKGKYIARQDQDDISLTDRLEVQVEFLENNLSIGLVGSNYHVIDNWGKVVGTTDVFTSPDDLKISQIFLNQFGHGSIMARKSLLSANAYNPKYKYAEDYELWTRLSHKTKIANIKEPLYMWRKHETNMTMQDAAEMKEVTSKIRQREFRFYLNNKSAYRLFVLDIFSTKGGLKKYFDKKGAMYRDMALMYCYSGLRRDAIRILLLSILFAPWCLKTYSQLMISVFKKNNIPKIKYEAF